MYQTGFDYNDCLADILARRTKYLDEIALLPSEKLAWEFSADRLAVSVYFDSTRPIEILKVVQRVAFPMFPPQPLLCEGDRCLATFRIAA